MINIVFCSDNNNLWSLAVTGRSLLDHLTQSCNIVVLQRNISLENQQKIRQSWNNSIHLKAVQFVEISTESLSSFRTTLSLRSKMAYARFQVANYLQREEKCLYLDTDLIICSDLAELYGVDVSQCCLAGVRDMALRKSNPQRVLYSQNVLGLKNPTLYFNSGVLLINLDRWRAEDVCQRAYMLSQEIGNKISFHDQDLLNILVEGQWQELETKWNLTQYEAKVDSQDGIIHLTGTVKPWHVDYEYLFADRFFEILDRTAFAGQRPKNFLGLGKPLKNLSRRIPSLDMIKTKAKMKANHLLNRSA